MAHAEIGIHLGAFQGPFRALYRRWMEELETLVAEADLSSRENFHHAMFLLSRLGLNQVDFAREYGFQPSTVNRWANGQKAPPKLRRGPVVKQGLGMLLAKIEQASPDPQALPTSGPDTDLVILKSYPEDDQGAPTLSPGRVHQR